MDFQICLERFPLPLGAWNALRNFIGALPEPSINYFVTKLADFERCNGNIVEKMVSLLLINTILHVHFEATWIL